MRCTLFKAWPIFGLDCDCEKVPPVPVEIGNQHHPLQSPPE